MKWGLTLLVLILGILSTASSAHADVYIYTDKDGLIHITNIPENAPGSTPAKTKKTENTFNWKNDLGVLQRVHRVGVRKYDHLIQKAAEYYSLPPALIKAVIAVESSFESTAISPAGAQGLMQLIPPTAKEMSVVNAFDPEQNIYGGTRYLRVLANQFDGDLRLTVAAYNAGPGAVRRKGGIPNYAETKKYVKRVIKLYHHYLQSKDLN